MEAMTGLITRIDGLERRVDANHDSIGSLRGKQADHGTEIAVIHTELAGMRSDLDEMRDEVRDQLAWLRRGLWVAAGTFLMFFVAAITLLAQLTVAG